jgi:hypothetical protein
MPSPLALERTLLRLSDATLLHVITTFLHGIADQSADDLHQWCQTLGFRVLPEQEATSCRASTPAPNARRRLLLAPDAQTLRQRIERLSQVGQRTMAVPLESPLLPSGFWGRTAVVEGLSTSFKEQWWDQDQQGRDLEELAVFTLCWAGQRLTLRSKTALFRFLQRLPIGSAFAIQTLCHQQPVSQGRYCLLLADSTFATGPATYAWLSKPPQVFEQVVLESGMLALPGRKLIAILQGDRHQVAFLEPLACEDSSERANGGREAKGVKKGNIR